jgi:hypothetical protein
MTGRVRFEIMVLNLVIVFIYLGVYATLGSVVLALVPAFRLTLLNVVVFILGAIGGAVVFSVIFSYASESTVLQRLSYVFFYLLFFGSAAFGGTLSVWLKARFIKTPKDSRLL